MLLLSIDFDGVIHSYTSGWTYPLIAPDPPVPGAIEFLLKASRHFVIGIHSSRLNYRGGEEMIRDYLFQCLKDVPVEPIAEELGITAPSLMELRQLLKDRIMEFKYFKEKPPAFLHLDDRAMTFNGVFPDPEALLKFKPWNKRPPVNTSSHPLDRTIAELEIILERLKHERANQSNS